MKHPDPDEVFKDFESKIKGKKESYPKEEKEHKKNHEDKEEEKTEDMKKKYQHEKQLLKEKYKKEMHAVHEKEVKEALKQGKTIRPGLRNAERITYLLILVILVGYVAVDYYQDTSKSSDTESNIVGDITVTTPEETEEDKTQEAELEEDKEEEKEEEAKEEEKKLSGSIDLTLDKVYKEVNENDPDLGELSRIVFTINNGKDKVLTPVLEAFVYDNNNEKEYETKIRGKYTYAAGIKPGDSHTGSIDLSPKMFRNLNLKKHIRLTLNDTKSGFITAVNDGIYIS